MPRFFFAFFTIFVLPSLSIAQLLPKEGHSINYRLAMFAFPAQQGTKSYTIQIAKGNYTTTDSFNAHTVRTEKTTQTNVIIELPEFGTAYTWRVLAGNATNAELHHFSINSSPFVNTNQFRLHIIKPASAFQEGYVFLDGTRTLYDMSGKPVWFMPNIPNVVEETSAVRDLKATPQGTITFLLGEGASLMAYEIDYNGKVLWKGPNTGIISGDSLENYHHEFTRLANGHYMTLGTEFKQMNLGFPEIKKVNREGMVNGLPRQPKGIASNKIPFGTLIEYDKEGNVVWSWKSSSYFLGGSFTFPHKPGRPVRYITHANSFYYSPADSAVYVGFKNISHILKVSYPGGAILRDYGSPEPGTLPNDNSKKFEAGVENGNGLYCGQHSCRKSKEGYLLVFNNNSCDSGAPSKVVMLKEVANVAAGLESVWEYECEGDNAVPKTIATGGNALELSDGTIFAVGGKLVLINRNKQTLWSAVAETWDVASQQWKTALQYRASILENRGELEKLIGFNK